jgi:DNA polymerase III alpha subunit (gram-positive type)
MTLANETSMNPLRDKNYFSLDLELNNKSDGSIPKIIQVGVCVGSPARPEEIQTRSWYIDPEENISPFITQLTGITDEIIQEKSVSHETVASELGEIIKENQCFCNPLVWGGNNKFSDASELKDEFTQRNIDFPFFGRRVVDVKTLYVFNQMVQGKSPSGGLRKSMLSYGLDFIGQSHNAEYDALNTLRFFFYFLERQRMFENFKDSMKNLK